MTSSITTHCPESIRAENRKNHNQETWDSQKWKEMVSSWTAGKVCVLCGSDVGIVPHHEDIASYGTEEYLDLTDCIPYCNSCHSRSHKGLVKCSKCGKLSKFETCWNCLSDEEKNGISLFKILLKKRAKEYRKKLNPKLKVVKL